MYAMKRIAALDRVILLYRDARIVVMLSIV